MGTPDIDPMPRDLRRAGGQPGDTLPDKQAMSVVPLIDTGSLLDGGPLLNLNLDLDLDADIAAPIDAAIAGNANVAVPIDAAVVGQRAVRQRGRVWPAPIRTRCSRQHLAGDAIANADQDVRSTRVVTTSRPSIRVARSRRSARLPGPCST